MIPWLYDLNLWVLSVLIDLFFREVHPRGAWRIPRKDPIILVAAPHANQFVDSLILMRILKTHAKRRISWLIAEKSTKRQFIGTAALAAGALPVARALDSQKPGVGKILLPDPINDPTLIKGIGTNFKTPQYQVGGLIVLPQKRKKTPSTEIAEVISETELRLKKPFKTPEALESLTGRDDISEDGKFQSDDLESISKYEGTNFKVAPHVDQGQVYDAVFDLLEEGGCVGIFPEGGSHDRPDLLPLKAGVAIMALGALAANPNCGVKIIPCGMNYFHPHKFRSRAVIEFGPAIEIHPELVEAYKRGDRRNAVGSLLETVYQSLVSVTQTSPDYDTLMLIQAARRLYNPTGKKLPLPLVVELNRRLVKGYTKYKDDPRIIKLKQSVNDYNHRLKFLGIPDHQVAGWGDNVKHPRWEVLLTLIYRLGKIAVLTIGTLPGLALFWPVFVVTKLYSMKKSKEALAASTVKLAGRDVMATWKLLIAMAFAPALYAYYTVIMTTWTWYNRIGGYYTEKVPWWMRATTYLPDWVPLWLVACGSLVVCIAVTFAALRIGEIGMDILKSLRVLLVALSPRGSNQLISLRQRREELAKEVTDVINDFGPELYPDFDADRVVADPFREGAYQSRLRRIDSNISEGSEPRTPVEVTPASPPGSPGPEDQTGLPRRDSWSNIGRFGFFSTRPSSRSRSRSRSSSAGGLVGSAGFPIKAFSTINNQESYEEVTKRIRGAMQERGKQRRNNQSGDWDIISNGTNASGDGDGDGDEAKKDR